MKVGHKVGHISGTEHRRGHPRDRLYKAGLVNFGATVVIIDGTTHPALTHLVTGMLAIARGARDALSVRPETDGGAGNRVTHGGSNRR